MKELTEGHHRELSLGEIITSIHVRLGAMDVEGY